tara:strand:+ start:3832 stop:4248 length:417 start_codon:yes stop_codon:yes gene_type:complete
MINSQEIDKKTSNKINQFKPKVNNIDTKITSKADFVLKNIPRLKIEQLKNKIDTDIDIFSLENIRENKSSIQINDFKLIGLVDIKGKQSILISFMNEIKSFQKGELINNKFRIKEISFKPDFVIFQKDEKEIKVLLNK